VVLVMGLDGTVEGEGHDRQSLPCDGQSDNSIFGLPGCQFQMLSAGACVCAGMVCSRRT
jgi:hypothetical protein